MITRLDLLQAVIVVDVLRCVVEVDEDLRIAIWKESIDRMSVLGAFKVNEHVDKLIQRKSRYVDVVDHFERPSIIRASFHVSQLFEIGVLEAFDLVDPTFVAATFKIGFEESPYDVSGLRFGQEPCGE